jgi:hypothetical protein
MCSRTYPPPPSSVKCTHRHRLRRVMIPSATVQTEQLGRPKAVSACRQAACKRRLWAIALRGRKISPKYQGMEWDGVFHVGTCVVHKTRQDMTSRGFLHTFSWLQCRQILLGTELRTVRCRVVWYDIHQLWLA